MAENELHKKTKEMQSYMDRDLIYTAFEERFIKNSG